tara:strand:+ start:133 stop:486 length:354 start_codon:yes stop_codon:yes gene_type:complete
MKTLKKIKPLHWVLIALAVYFLFLHPTTTRTEEVTNGNGNGNGVLNPSEHELPFGLREGVGVSQGFNGGDGGKKLCPAKKCKEVRSRGIFGIGRRVAKDWCHPIAGGGGCECLGDPC